MTGLYRNLTSTPSNNSEMNWNRLYPPTSLPNLIMLLWLNGNKTLPGSNILWKEWKGVTTAC